MRNLARIYMRWLLAAALGLLLSVGLLQQSAQAETQPLARLGRGVLNTSLGWTEIPQQMYEVSRTEHPLAGLTSGAVEGAAHAITRTTGGSFDTLTFLFPHAADNPDPSLPITLYRW